MTKKINREKKVRGGRREKKNIKIVYYIKSKNIQ
jgi:hypothetical protein